MLSDFGKSLGRFIGGDSRYIFGAGSWMLCSMFFRFPSRDFFGFGLLAGGNGLFEGMIIGGLLEGRLRVGVIVSCPLPTLITVDVPAWNGFDAPPLDEAGIGLLLIDVCEDVGIICSELFAESLLRDACSALIAAADGTTRSAFGAFGSGSFAGDDCVVVGGANDDFDVVASCGKFPFDNLMNSVKKLFKLAGSVNCCSICMNVGFE